MIAYQSIDGIRFESENYVPAEGETLMPALPAWNAATERIAWENGAWQVIALTPAQLAAKSSETAVLADMNTDRTERIVVRNLITALRAGNATNAQVQRAVAYLLKRL